MRHDERIARILAKPTYGIREVLCRKYLSEEITNLDIWSLLFDCLLKQNNHREIAIQSKKLLAAIPGSTDAMKLCMGALIRSMNITEASEIALTLPDSCVTGNPKLAKSVYYLRLLAALDGRAPEQPAALMDLGGQIETFNRGRLSGRVDVVCYLRCPFHYAIQKEIAGNLRDNRVNTLFSDNIWFALAAKPKVLVVSEALYTELEPVRRHLPECLIVNTRHGLGDKNHAALGASQCDRICVSSPSIADLLAEQMLVPREKIWVTGYPQMDGLFRTCAAGPGKTDSQGGRNKTVLFAPTFNPGLSAATLLTENLVQSIRGDNTDIHILIRPHPHLPTKAPELIARWSDEAAINPNVVLETDSALNLMDLFVDVDLMISDVSSAALAWLALGRPLICLVNRNAAAESPHYAPDGLEWRMLECAHAVDDPHDLSSAVQAALQGPDGMAEDRNRFAEYLFGDLKDGMASQRTAGLIINHLRENAP